MIILQTNSIRGQQIAALNNLEMLQYDVRYFADGSCELSLDKIGQALAQMPKNEVLYIFHEFYKPMNAGVAPLLAVLAFCKKYTKNIVLLAPFMPFLRQKEYGVANLFDDIQIITLDAHVLKPNIISLRPDFFAKNVNSSECIILPDAGAKVRYAEWIDDRFVFAQKNRKHDQHCFENLEKAANKRCLILDDILDSGYTLRSTINLLQKHGAKSISASITHSFFDISTNFQQWGLDFLQVSDTLIEDKASIGRAQCEIVDYASVFRNLKEQRIYEFE